MDKGSLDELALSLQQKAYESIKKHDPSKDVDSIHNAHAAIFLQSVGEINRIFGTQYVTRFATIKEYYDKPKPATY